MIAADLLLEVTIDRAYEAVIDAATDDQLRAAWFELGNLIAQRSPLRIGRMERARGLRPPTALPMAGSFTYEN